jgi:serine phosphatase RsbU (regulator of sigma subunit)
VVQTVTRIVSVVPLPLRILIAVLAAAALAFAARSRIAAARAKRLEKQRGELLQDVGLLQAALLPGSPERIGALGASTAYRPANGPAAGGDFYDLFALEDGRLTVIVGDISGHGRQALPHTALMRFTLRAYLEAGFSPREALQTAGAALERQLGDSFATVALATYQPRERILTYACAGHPPPLVLAAAPFVPVIAAAAPPIGAGMQTGTRQTVLSLPGAARICMYTDGITEARVGSELYGTERLANTVEELGPQASAAALLDRVAGQTDAQPDDMAACLLTVTGGEEAPRVLSEEIALCADQIESSRTKQFLLACGVARAEVREILLAAGVEAVRSRGAMLQVRPRGPGEPAQVSVRPDNVAPMHSVKLRREMAGVR